MTTNTISGGPIVPDGKPSKTYGGGKKRVCENDGCSVFLSKYNAKEFCASCWNAIPLLDRPYSHRDAWSGLPN